jgi:hypothetical protein
MPKLFCIIPMSGGAPSVDFSATPLNGYVLADQIGQFGAYLVSGSAAQLVALNALPNVVGIVAVTEAGNVRWAELDGVIAPAVRTKLNTFLTARGWPTIPAGVTYRVVIRAAFKRFNASFEIEGMDISEPA